MLPKKENRKACKALLIEDDEIDRRAIRRALRHNPTPFLCDHVCLLDGVGKLLKQEKYDIILTDMNLPDSTGLDTITSLLSLVDNTPIVILSGTDDDAIALEAVRIGAQDYIPKQYIKDAELINRTLRHAMERHQLRIGLEQTRDREHFLANYDQCTSLPNRLLFLDRINQAVTLAKRNKSEFAIFFIDLDRFKRVNDTLGHSAGDEVLRCVGERMKALIRSSDTVARFGGDEFVLILQQNDDHNAMKRLAEKLIETINRPIPFGHHQCSVGSSIGVACYPHHGHTPQCLIKNADMAMYEAKKKGRNQVQFFTQELFEKQNRFFSLEKALREALLKPEANFKLCYQPRVRLSTGNIHSVEALIRWHHSSLGNIPPSQFIPLAENLGLIESIDKWVLEAACQKAQQWKTMNNNIRIGVNISGHSFNQRTFVSKIVEPLLEKYSMDEHCLEMEITEGVLLTDTQQVLNRLKALKSLGISLAIDDFGTGFSSLNYLNHFPIDTLKIDGSFTCDKYSNRRKQALVNAIIALGKALEMNVVAEGIDTKEKMEYLSNLSCHEGQGYFWCKPDANWTPPTASNCSNTAMHIHHSSSHRRQQASSR